MPSRSGGLFTSRVMASLQCHKRLWWAVHEPIASELPPDEALQPVFDESTQVGEVARISVPGRVLTDLPSNVYAERMVAKAAAWKAGRRSSTKPRSAPAKSPSRWPSGESRSDGARVTHPKARPGGSDVDLDRLVALCRTCHAQTDAAYATGRLVVTPLGAGRVVCALIAELVRDPTPHAASMWRDSWSQFDSM